MACVVIDMFLHIFCTNFLDGLLNALFVRQRRDFQAHSCACLHMGDAICALPLENCSMSHIIQLHNIITINVTKIMNQINQD